MAVYEQYRRTSPHSPQDQQPPLGDLFKRLSQDASALVRDEITLAKLELKESAKDYAKDMARLVVAASIAWLGLLALGAFLILALGEALDNYWLSALIVTIALLGAGAALARSALAQMKKHSLAPEATVETLKQDKQWASHELRDFKQKLKA